MSPTSCRRHCLQKQMGGEHAHIHTHLEPLGVASLVVVLEALEKRRARLLPLTLLMSSVTGRPHDSVSHAKRHEKSHAMSGRGTQGRKAKQCAGIRSRSRPRPRPGQSIPIIPSHAAISKRERDRKKKVQGGTGKRQGAGGGGTYREGAPLSSGSLE